MSSRYSRPLPPIPVYVTEEYRRHSPLSLPFELIVIIIAFAVGNNTQGLSIPPNFSEPVWTLTRICSQWRKAALSIPWLWNSLEIHIGANSSPEHFVYIKDILPAQGPLFFNLWSDVHHHNLINLIVCPYLHRLKRLHLSLPIPSFVDFWTLSPQSLAGVSDISIEFLPGNHDHDDVDVYCQLDDITDFQYPASLDSLTLAAYDSDLAGQIASEAILSLPHIPWEQLKHLNLGYGIGPQYKLSLREMLDILVQCVSLQTFAIALKNTRRINLLDNYMPILPELTSVEIDLGNDNREGGCIADFLDLDLPWNQLTNLSLRMGCSFSCISTMLVHTFYLETLCLYLTDTHQTLVVPEQPMYLPHLHTLKLCTDFCSVLPFLHLPRLSNLVMWPSIQSTEVDVFPAEAIMELVLRSEHGLRCLEYHHTISPLYMPEQDIALHNLLSVVPKLRRFSVRYLHLSRAITKEIAHRLLLPELVELETKVDSPDVFAAAVERRAQYGFPRLMFVRGYYSPIYYTRYALAEPSKRLQLLNLELGTDLKLERLDTCLNQV